MYEQANLYIASHRGMAGSAIKRNLKSKGYYNLITCTRTELDLILNSKLSTTSSNLGHIHAYIHKTNMCWIFKN